jgi:hypothetical protein
MVLRSGTLNARTFKLEKFPLTNMPPQLAHGLESVLFESGPVWLKEPSNGKWNFPRYLGSLDPPDKFVIND